MDPNVICSCRCWPSTISPLLFQLSTQLTCLVRACYIALEQTVQKTLLPTVLQLSRHVFIIVETCLSSHCLATAVSSGLQPLCHNFLCAYNKLTLHLVHSSERVERWIPIFGRGFEPSIYMGWKLLVKMSSKIYYNK